MSTNPGPLKIGDMVTCPDDDRAWKVIHLYADVAILEFTGEAWQRFKRVARAELKPV